MDFEEWFDAQIWGNEDFKTCLLYAWEAATKACEIAVDGERLECPTDSDGDQAYEMAIRHAVEAIRKRPNV